jgi:hypothetical protein
MTLDLTDGQIRSIVNSELESYLAITDDERLRMALKIVIETLYKGEDDELQDIVATTAC